MERDIEGMIQVFKNEWKDNVNGGKKKESGNTVRGYVQHSHLMLTTHHYQAESWRRKCLIKKTAVGTFAGRLFVFWWHRLTSFNTRITSFRTNELEILHADEKPSRCSSYSTFCWEINANLCVLSICWVLRLRINSSVFPCSYVLSKFQAWMGAGRKVESRGWEERKFSRKLHIPEF